MILFYRAVKYINVDNFPRDHDNTNHPTSGEASPVSHPGIQNLKHEKATKTQVWGHSTGLPPKGIPEGPPGDLRSRSEERWRTSLCSTSNERATGVQTGESRCLSTPHRTVHEPERPALGKGGRHWFLGLGRKCVAGPGTSVRRTNRTASRTRPRTTDSSSVCSCFFASHPRSSGVPETDVDIKHVGCRSYRRLAPSVQGGAEACRGSLDILETRWPESRNQYYNARRTARSVGERIFFPHNELGLTVVQL